MSTSVRAVAVSALALFACGDGSSRLPRGDSSTSTGGSGAGASSSGAAGPTTSASVGGGGGGAAASGGSGGGGGDGSLPTGPDALYAKHFGGGAVCHRSFDRVAPALDGWVIGGSVEVIDGFANEPCSIQIGSTVIAPGPYAGWSVSFVAKLAPDGTPAWVLEYGLNKATMRAVRDLVVDSQGATHVIGETYSGFTVGPYDVLAGNYLLTIDAAGNAVALDQTIVPPLPQELAIDKDDNLYYGTSGKVVKLSPQGSSIASASFDFGGISGDTLSGLAVDDAGDVYYTGPSAQADFDIGIAKLDPDLGLAWSKTIGGVDEQSSFGLAVDASGGVTLVGAFAGSAALGGAPLIGVPDAPGRNGFVAGFDSGGAHRYSFGFGHDVGHDCCDGPRIASAPGGDVIVAGSASDGTLNFGGTSFALTSQPAMFVARVATSGTSQWARVFGPGALVGDVAVAADGRIAVVGSLSSSIDFGATTLVPSSSYGDAFVAVFPPQ